MSSIALLVAEHENILQFNRIVRIACAEILDGKEVCTADFKNMILFAKNYADKHHHGKEEQILFREMVDRLGKIGSNLITHGMLVEHDFGRLFISELENAINQYALCPSNDVKLDIIANAIGYTELLKRHIDKENEVIYAYAEKQLSKEVLDAINTKTSDFEKLAQENGTQKKYLDILNHLAKIYKA